jgi:hypothetical protein
MGVSPFISRDVTVTGNLAMTLIAAVPSRPSFRFAEQLRNGDERRPEAPINADRLVGDPARDRAARGIKSERRFVRRCPNVTGAAQAFRTGTEQERAFRLGFDPLAQPSGNDRYSAGFRTPA